MASERKVLKLQSGEAGWVEAGLLMDAAKISRQHVEALRKEHERQMAELIAARRALLVQLWQDLYRALGLPGPTPGEPYNLNAAYRDLGVVFLEPIETPGTGDIAEELLSESRHTTKH